MSGMKRKICARCDKRRSVSQFYKNRKRPDGLDEYCKDCRRAYFKAYRSDNDSFRETKRRGDRAYYQRHRKKLLRKVKSKRLQYMYGLSDVDHAKLLKAQSNACAICKRDIKLAVDHDHVTGKVRGLLCLQCNSGLGMFRDNQKYLTAAIRYLKANEAE